MSISKDNKRTEYFAQQALTLDCALSEAATSLAKNSVEARAALGEVMQKAATEAAKQASTVLANKISADTEKLNSYKDKEDYHAYRIIQYRVKHGLTQAALARELRMKPQQISRIEAALDADEGDFMKTRIAKEAPPTVKYALLKYCRFDVEENKEYADYDHALEYSNILSIPFLKDKEHEDNELNEQVMFMDIRWLKQDLKINSPDGLKILVAPEDSQANEDPSKNVNQNDLLLIDTTSFVPSRTEALYAVEVNKKIKLYRLKTDWEEKNISFYITNPNHKKVDKPKQFLIIGKVIWNGSHKVM